MVSPTTTRTRAAARAREIAALVADRLLLAFEDHGLITQGPPERRAIALSFDDGPSPANTPAALDLLAEHDARATFFVVGEEVAGREAILERMLAEGHEVGNHTYTHPETVHLRNAELLDEVMRTNALLDALGVRVRLVRPPYGKDRRRFAAIARQLDLNVALWSIDPKDTRADMPRIVSVVLERAAPGAIVLLHDGGERRPRTLAACAELMPALRQAGFELTTVSELLGWPGDASARLSPQHGDFGRKQLVE
jgi:peptidoglycan/xylan/chitin deacetylase (PgdA/CDA1 family)